MIEPSKQDVDRAERTNMRRNKLIVLLSTITITATLVACPRGYEKHKHDRSHASTAIAAAKSLPALSLGGERVWRK